MFVELFKTARALRKKRPVWQDKRPPLREGQDTYDIAARNEKKFADAFKLAVKALLTTQAEKDFQKAYEAGDKAGALNAFEFLNDVEDLDNKRWQGFVDALEEAYSGVISESGQRAAERMNSQFRTKMIFTIRDESGRIVKAKRPSKEEAAAALTVPMNPHAVKWMKARSLALVKQGITSEQKDVVRQIISDGFEKGIRAEAAYKAIKQNIGLTLREYMAVINRADKLDEQGYDKAEVEALSAKYSDQLLGVRAERIARTETIAAQAEGRNETWRIAQDEGILPKVQRVWSAPPAGPNPNAPCEICVGLDGKTAEIGGVYEGDDGEQYDMPPAPHPSCRCTEFLEEVS